MSTLHIKVSGAHSLDDARASASDSLFTLVFGLIGLFDMNLLVLSIEANAVRDRTSK